MLEIEHIDKSFGNYKALDDISFMVSRGTVFGLLGPNGAGKTTLIRIINRIIVPERGRLLLDGHPMSDDDVRHIGYLPEERGLYKKMRVGEQAIYLARLKGLSRHEAERRLKQWFDKFDIGSWWTKPVEQLSKGMQQKVQFIVTVVHEPQLLIFDEPFSGFDPLNASLLKEEILNLRRRGATVILSTHNMSSVEELCDEIALIDRSRLMLSGKVGEIRNSFSTNSYAVELAGVVDAVPSLPEWCKLSLQETIDADRRMLYVDMAEGRSTNELLQALLPHYQVLSLCEVLPSMNDIFIKVVSKGGAK